MEKERLLVAMMACIDLFGGEDVLMEQNGASAPPLLHRPEVHAGLAAGDLAGINLGLHVGLHLLLQINKHTYISFSASVTSQPCQILQLLRTKYRTCSGAPSRCIPKTSSKRYLEQTPGPRRPRCTPSGPSSCGNHTG